MPELPEVQTVVDTLKPRTLGQRIVSVLLNRSDVLTPHGFDLSGHLISRTVAAIDRRGKRIIFTLDNGNRFYIHLGMSGRLTIESPQTDLLKHTHLILEFKTFQIRFKDPRRFGGIWWLGSEEFADAKMGPEPLLIRPQQLAACLAKTRRPIKNALLDQTVIAGLGNIYVDESLFAAGIHPLTLANDISAEKVAQLTRAIKQTLRKALRHGGSTLRDYFDANGDAGKFQKLHAVYHRTAKKCRRCDSLIERIVLGGRSTHFCPSCQPH